MNREIIEKAIVELEILLEDENNSEEDYQEWFESHEVVFNTLGFSDFIAHPHFSQSSGYEKPDFIVQSPNGEWKIFEIKTPFQSIATKHKRRPKFYQSVEGFVTQCQNYSESLDERLVREYLQDRYDISGLRKRPLSILVVGLSKTEDMEVVHTLANRRNPSLTILTYDDILRSLKRKRLFSFENYDDADGLSIYTVISLLKKPRSASVNHILDVGKKESYNRISIFINDSDHICIKVYDTDGEVWEARSHQPLSPSAYNSENLFQFEVGVNEGLGFLSIQIGWDYKIDMNIPEFPFLSPKEFVIGSNWSGQAPSWFNHKALLVLSNILPFEVKKDVLATLMQGSDQLDWEDEFRGDGCVSTEGHPAQCSGRVTLDTSPS
jgi:hypothetical protein